MGTVRVDVAREILISILDSELRRVRQSAGKRCRHSGKNELPKWEMAAARSCSVRASSYCGCQAQAMLIVAVVERVEEIAEGWRTR